MLDSDASTPRRRPRSSSPSTATRSASTATTSKAVVTQTLDSATGGSVVRADQVVDGVPVFGGQVVMSLDDDQGVVSVSSATTEATQVPAPGVERGHGPGGPRSAVTAREPPRAAPGPDGQPGGRRLYDPALVHTADPMGVRPVWQFEVTNGSDIRETVLVGTDRGEVALHFNDAPEASTGAGLRQREAATSPSSDDQVPVCITALRAPRASPRSSVGRRQRGLRQPGCDLRRLRRRSTGST